MYTFYGKVFSTIRSSVVWNRVKQKSVNDRKIKMFDIPDKNKCEDPNVEVERV